jgi:hypothetical protein
MGFPCATRAVTVTWVPFGKWVLTSGHTLWIGWNPARLPVISGSASPVRRSVGWLLCATHIPVNIVAQMIVTANLIISSAP